MLYHCCCFSGEGEREELGRGGVFFFDHVRDLCSDGRGLACEDQLGGWVCADGFELAGFWTEDGVLRK
jgi:hypothetical protein